MGRRARARTPDTREARRAEGTAWVADPTAGVPFPHRVLHLTEPRPEQYPEAVPTEGPDLPVANQVVVPTEGPDLPVANQVVVPTAVADLPVAWPMAVPSPEVVSRVVVGRRKARGWVGSCEFREPETDL